MTVYQPIFSFVSNFSMFFISLNGLPNLIRICPHIILILAIQVHLWISLITDWDSEEKVTLFMFWLQENKISTLDDRVLIKREGKNCFFFFEIYFTFLSIFIVYRWIHIIFFLNLSKFCRAVAVKLVLQFFLFIFIFVIGSFIFL